MLHIIAASTSLKMHLSKMLSAYYPLTGRSGRAVAYIASENLLCLNREPNVTNTTRLEWER
jgi:hypothetical protein